MKARINKKKAKKILKEKHLEPKIDALQYEALKKEIESLKNLSRGYESELSVLSEIKTKLRDAQLKYRDITLANGQLKEELTNTKATNATLINSITDNSLLESHYRDFEVENKRLAKDLLKLKMLLNEKDVDLAQAELAVIEARNASAKLKNTLSFRLGYELIFGFKSWKGFITLPKKLVRLRSTAKERRVEKKSTIALTVDSLQSEVFESNKNPIKLDTGTNADLPAVLKSLRVASVMDEFTFNSFSPECNLFGLTPQNWKKELEAFKPEIVFIESAWRGKLDLWGSKIGHMSQEIVDVALWCRENNVPSLFWNKEDPVHFETFLNTARLFDYIFTTDIDCVTRYKSALQHDNVYFLPFAAQPKNNNPIEKFERKDAFCFAGAYYKKYPERTKDLGNFALSLPEFKPLDIYDRNFGKSNPEYMFPEEYQPFIVGTLAFNEIDKAYKGYNYAINLNSIKQSQSMFARRVFELLASNTITVSNFSKGLRNIFGDLVFTSDSGLKIVSDLEKISQSNEEMRKFRLLGLRKVLSEHTYQDRLSYVYSKLTDTSVSQLLPNVYVFSYVKNQDDFEIVYAQFLRQKFAYKKLLIVTPAGVTLSCDESISVKNIHEADELFSTVLQDEWVSLFVKEDFYDEYYLEDLVLSTRYVDSDVIGKSGYFKNNNSIFELNSSDNVYKNVSELIARASIVKAKIFTAEKVKDIIPKVYTQRFSGECFSIDEYSYCMNGFGAKNVENITKVSVEIDQGLSIHSLNSAAESKQALLATSKAFNVVSAKALFELIPRPSQTMVNAEEVDSQIKLTSSLPDGKHEYWYAKDLISPNDLGASDNTLSLFLETGVGLNLQFVLFFIDSNGQKISHVIKAANKNHTIELPTGTRNIRFGLRIYAAGEAVFKQLYLEHKPSEPVDILQKSETLLITNNYPSYEDLYKNGFVHSRVKGYQDAGSMVDVWRFKPESSVSYHEFENVDVTTGGADYLAHALKTNTYKHILVHFLDDSIWQVIKEYLPDLKVTVWLHGSDIQSYERRAFMYETEEQIQKAKKVSDVKQEFWKAVLKPFHENLHLVFVSNYLAETAMEDLGIVLESHQYSVISNPIDTDLFNYIKKPVEQRKKILSIRPYASKIYANDLAVKAVLELSNEAFFNELEFRFIGDGPLFDETLEPLRKFSNVIIERKFLSRVEIANLHKEYGVFLCPSRMDTQGVSRDEAMASGLVPITNAVAAIPEFVNSESGFIVPSECYKSLAFSVSSLIKEPTLFNDMSLSARELVASKSNRPEVIRKEIKVFGV